MLKVSQAMVFAAGKGERLHPFTLTTPKPLLTIQGKTLLDTALDRLERQGVLRCVVNTHYLNDQIEQHLTSRVAPAITVSYEPDLLDTGGGLLNVLSFFGDNLLWTFNTDAWWGDLEENILGKMVGAWRDEDMDCLLLQTPRLQAIGFSRVDYHLGTEGRLYTPSSYRVGDHIYAGIQLIHPRALEGFRSGKFSLKAVWDKAETKGRLFGIPHDGYWADIATLEVLQEVEDYIHQGKMKR